MEMTPTRLINKLQEFVNSNTNARLLKVSSSRSLEGKAKTAQKKLLVCIRKYKWHVAYFMVSHSKALHDYYYIYSLLWKNQLIKV